MVDKSQFGSEDEILTYMLTILKERGSMMDQLKNYYKEMGVDEKVFDYAQEVERD